MRHQLGNYEPNTPDVDIPIFLAESESFGKVGAHDFSIKQFHLATMLQRNLRLLLTLQS
jgi:hypothetical protein